MLVLRDLLNQPVRERGAVLPRPVLGLPPRVAERVVVAKLEGHRHPSVGFQVHFLRSFGSPPLSFAPEVGGQVVNSPVEPTSGRHRYELTERLDECLEQFPDIPLFRVRFRSTPTGEVCDFSPGALRGQPDKKTCKNPVSGSLRIALYPLPSENSTGDESRWAQVAIIRDSG